MTTLTIALDPGALTAAATLPVTFGIGPGRDADVRADVRAIDGAPGWANRAAAEIADGARGVLIVRPSAEPDGILAELAASEVPVVLDTRWRHNPTAVAAVERFGALVGGASLLEARAVVATVAELDDAVRDLAVLAQAVAGPIDALSTVGRWPARRVLAARIGAVRVHLSADVTRVDAGAARLRALGATGGVDLRIPDAGTARAALLTATDSSGCVLTPTRYESAHRASLRRLAAAVDGTERVTDLDDFRRVSAMALAQS